MEKQLKMSGIDSRLSIAADKAVEIFEEERKLKIEKKKVFAELLNAMGEVGKTSLRCKGFVLHAQFVQEKWKLQVKQE